VESETSWRVWLGQNRDFGLALLGETTDETLGTAPSPNWFLYNKRNTGT
jgi:hypothetical protein